MSRVIYLDYNATSPVLPEVKEAMIPYFCEKYGNPSSLHRLGRDAKRAVEEARESVAKLLGAEPSEIIFTSGGSESDNLAIKGYVESLSEKKNIHIITSAVEHHAVINTMGHLEDKGLDVSYVGVDEKGRLDIGELTEEITEDTKIVSIMYANNETGTIFDIPKIVEAVRKNGGNQIVFHTDAVQAAGKIPLDVKKQDIDMLSISGHKIGAPKGIGALYIRKGFMPRPQIHGGHHESNLRAGTENVPGIIGLGAAARVAMDHMAQNAEKLKNLRDKLEDGIIKTVDHVYINGDKDNRLPNTSNMSFEYIEGEGLLLNLDMEGIFVSSGSACTSNDFTISHVLSAMDVDKMLGQGSVRFSLGDQTQEDDIDYVIEKIVPIVSRLRKISPLYPRSS